MRSLVMRMTSVATLVGASILASTAAACSSSTPAAALPEPDGGDASATPVEAGEAAAPLEAGEAATPVEAAASGEAGEAPEVADAAPVGDAGGTTQTPPMGAAAVTAWLATGVYKSWHCEAAPHLARSPSPHGYDRICSNDVIADNATGTGPWPEGAAAVKELYTTTTGPLDAGTPGGYAVYLKTEADSGMGANWYFYGALVAGGAAVDGLGSTTPVMEECGSCHVAAGMDAAHTPSPGGRDEVYTPVH
jgi:hypothetical protein